MKTPAVDQDTKMDLIEHINQDHTDEVLAIVHAFADLPDAEHAYIVDIHPKGAEIHVTYADHEQTVFVAFQINGDLEEQLLYSAYLAMAKLGRSLSGQRRQFFEVVNTDYLTDHLLRITLKSSTPLPKNKPAFAYGFWLKTFQTTPKSQPNPSNGRKSPWQSLLDRGLLWLMKKMSSQQRQKMIQGMNKGIRYYTLQSSFKSSAEAAFNDMGYVDVFLHGKTSASTWAQGLNPGDIIQSRVEHSDKHENLATGQALLIADESGYPALLGLLQHWHNPVSPWVILLSANACEQAYFDDTSLAPATCVKRIVCPPEQQGEALLKAFGELGELGEFTTTWGAFEKSAAKTVRSHLRNTLSFKGRDNRIQGYWVLDRPAAE